MQEWIYQPSDSLLMLGDFNASYHIFPYEVDPNIELVIKGQFPYARYMSFSVTGIIDTIIVNVSDRNLIPDPGNVNPFLPGANWNADNRNYTLRIVFSTPSQGSDFFVPEAGNNIHLRWNIAKWHTQSIWVHWTSNLRPGRLIYIGNDELDNQIYTLSCQYASKLMIPALRDMHRIAGGTDENLLLVCTLETINIYMKIGGFTSRRLKWVGFGRPIVVKGTLKAISKLPS